MSDNEQMKVWKRKEQIKSHEESISVEFSSDQLTWHNKSMKSSKRSRIHLIIKDLIRPNTANSFFGIEFRNCSSHFRDKILLEHLQKK